MALYQDIDLNFNLDAKGDILMVSDIEAINQGLRILVETITGSRPGVGNERFGLYIKKYLFSELSYAVAHQMGKEIQRQIEAYEERINLESVNVDIDYESSAYLIEILYLMKNTGITGSFRMIVSVK